VSDEEERWSHFILFYFLHMWCISTVEIYSVINSNG